MSDKSASNLASLSPQEQLELAMKYAPEDHPSPRAYVDLVKSQIMGLDKKGNPRPFEDLIYFLNVSKRAGLDPSLKQIYPVYRWSSRAGKEVMSIQTGIDGFRSVAERSGLYAGSDDGVFEEDETGLPKKATVTVYKLNPKTGERMPISASARWSEYAQTNKDGKPTDFWKRMPFNQLEKCAESKALRKAFPLELSQIYSDDEMKQADKMELPTPKRFQKPDKVEEGEVVEDGTLKSEETKAPNPDATATADKLLNEVKNESNS